MILVIILGTCISENIPLSGTSFCFVHPTATFFNHGLQVSPHSHESQAITLTKPLII